MKSMSFTGHRSQKLGGPNFKNPTMLNLKNSLLVEIEYFIVVKKVSTFYTGGATGADQAAFWCVEILKKKYPHVKNIVAIPFADFGKPTYSDKHKKMISWTPEQIQWFEEMKKRADEVIYVDEVLEYQKDKRTPIEKFSFQKLQIRNEFLVDKANYLMSIWDGVAKGGTWNCLEYAFKQNHLIEIIQIHAITFERFVIQKKEED